MTRTKGSLGRKTQLLEIKARELGCDPFEILILFAKGDYKKLGYKKEQITPQLRASMAAEACEYIHSKRQKIEHTGANDEPLFQDLSGINDEQLGLIEKILNGNQSEDAQVH